MPHHPLRRERPFSLLAVAALAIGICLVVAPAASAQVRPSLESTVGEETATAPLQETTTDTPAESPISEASGESGREQRHKRHEERRERRQRRRAGHEFVAATGCTVTLDATPSLVTAEDPLSLSGTLSCPEQSNAAGQTVTLFQMLARSVSSYEAATTTTEADGTYQFTPTSLAVNSDFFVSADGAQSQTTRVKVSPHVTIATPLAGTQLLVGSGHATRAAANSDSANAVTFTGMVTPANAGTRVALQRETGDGAWARIGGAEVNAQGEYSIAHTFYRPGRANIRVIVHGHGLTMTTVSAPVTYQVVRRHNRQITVPPSVEPPAGEVPPAA
jgi:hypothetical protein